MRIDDKASLSLLYRGLRQWHGMRGVDVNLGDPLYSSAKREYCETSLLRVRIVGRCSGSRTD